MKKLLRRLLFADTVITEYTTITLRGDINEGVYLETDGRMIDISSHHWLLCLDPVVFGIWAETTDDMVSLNKKNGFKIYFKDVAEKNTKRNTVAVLTLDFFDQIEEEDGTLFLLKLRKCRIYHNGFIRTFLLFFKYYKKPGLSFSKLKSFAAAYSYPRRVRIISFKDGNYYNIFPMDLLGPIPHSSKYVFGLRHTNIALPKIIESGKIVVSEISYEYKDIIYLLGRHHSIVPPALDALPFKTRTSEDFGFYIPEWADSYREIIIDRTINLGSHMLLWGECKIMKELKSSDGYLFHIHFLHYLHQQSKENNYTLV